MNKTNYKRITFGNIVNKSGITILIILIFSVNLYPAATLPYGNIDDGLPNTNHFSLDELNQIDLSWLHDQGYNGSNIKIGIMDNGVDFLHEAFENINYTEKSFDTPDQQSTQTHGTPVSGIIVGYEEGNVNGSAPGSTVGRTRSSIRHNILPRSRYTVFKQ